MPSAATLNVQPRQRRDATKASPAAHRPVREGPVGVLDVPEPELRDALRKLDAAGLVQRIKGTWSAVPMDGDKPESGSDS